MLSKNYFWQIFFRRKDISCRFLSTQKKRYFLQIFLSSLPACPLRHQMRYLRAVGPVANVVDRRAAGGGGRREAARGDDGGTALQLGISKMLQRERVMRGWEKQVAEELYRIFLFCI